MRLASGILLVPGTATLPSRRHRVSVVRCHLPNSLNLLCANLLVIEERSYTKPVTQAAYRGGNADIFDRPASSAKLSVYTRYVNMPAVHCIRRSERRLAVSCFDALDILIHVDPSVPVDVGLVDELLYGRLVACVVPVVLRVLLPQLSQS